MTASQKIIITEQYLRDLVDEMFELTTSQQEQQYKTKRAHTLHKRIDETLTDLKNQVTLFDLLQIGCCKCKHPMTIEIVIKPEFYENGNSKRGMEWKCPTCNLEYTACPICGKPRWSNEPDCDAYIEHGAHDTCDFKRFNTKYK